MTVAVTKKAEEKFIGVVKLAKLLENVGDTKVLFKELPDFYIEDLKNHSIAFDFMKKALTHEEDKVIRNEMQHKAEETLFQKLKENGVDISFLTATQANIFTHWSQNTLLFTYGQVKVLTYSIVNRGCYCFDLDDMLRQCELKISLVNQELEEIRDKDTSYFKKKKEKLENSIAHHNERKSSILSNRETIEHIQSTFQKILKELSM